MRCKRDNREYEQEYLKNEIFRANREKIDRFMAYIKENAEKKSLDHGGS